MRVSARTAALGLLLGFTAVALVGYGVFALHPERLPSSPLLVGVYRVSFPAFAQIHIALSALALGVALVTAAGFRWLPALGLVYVASFAAEFVGTGYGIPFGGYSYSSLLGLQLGGRVPALIPLSWFVMAVPSFALARAALPGRGRRIGRLVVAALLLVSWDVALDPAMSRLTPYWSWTEPGPYYGMPMENLAGWLLTGVVVMGLLEVAGASDWTRHLGNRWSATFYGTVLLMPLGMCLAAGLWDVAGYTALALGLCAGVALLARRLGPEAVTPTRTEPAATPPRPPLELTRSVGGGTP